MKKKISREHYERNLEMLLSYCQEAGVTPIPEEQSTEELREALLQDASEQESTETEEDKPWWKFW